MFLPETTAPETGETVEPLVEGVPLSLYNQFITARDCALSDLTWDYSAYTYEDFATFFGNKDYAKTKPQLDTMVKRNDEYFYTFSYNKLDNTLHEIGLELDDDIKAQYKKWWLDSDKYRLWCNSVDHLYDLLEEMRERENQQSVQITETTQPAPETTKANPPETIPPEPQYLNLVRYVTVNVKARTAPAQDAANNGVVYAGTKVTLKTIDTSTGWCMVEWNGADIYVLQDYLSDTKPEQNNPGFVYPEPQQPIPTTGQYSTKTPTGEAIGQYALNRGYNPNDGTFFGGTKEQIGDQYYTTLAGMTVFAPADSLSMEHAQGSKVRITSDMENVKNYVTADEYAKLQSDLDWVYKNTGIGKNAPEVLMLVCLPDGSYILNAGPHNTDVWIDPNDSSCKYVYDDYGCLCKQVEWPELYPGTTYREQIINDSNGGNVAPPSVYKADAIIAGDKRPNMGAIGRAYATVAHAGKY